MKFPPPPPKKNLASFPFYGSTSKKFPNDSKHFPKLFKDMDTRKIINYAQEAHYPNLWNSYYFSLSTRCTLPRCKSTHRPNYDTSARDDNIEQVGNCGLAAVRCGGRWD
uniref:Uncharacterized protein n=1 Tax=Sphaerodactylus townsendi TaxID=933632 RepID=A0ACB8F1W2_9SAUR